jgi:hypothetical protein
MLRPSSHADLLLFQFVSSQLVQKWLGIPRPSPGRNEKLEDKIADEKDEQIRDPIVSHEIKKIRERILNQKTPQSLGASFNWLHSLAWRVRPVSLRNVRWQPSLISSYGPE